MRPPRIRSVLACALVLSSSIAAAVASTGEPTNERRIGVNILLNAPIDAAILAQLGRHGTVLDELPEIRAVTMRTKTSEVPAIQALAWVASATPDVVSESARFDGLPFPDLAAGAGTWNLDAIDVANAGGVRTVGYDGDGVYVAVIDTGLPQNWRDYFPEERIATDLARAFLGGGGLAHTVHSQPETWEHDTDGHGGAVASVVLGFAYEGPDAALPAGFQGVAPRATVIPIRPGFSGNGFHSGHWESTVSMCILYAARLKADGALGGAPLVINLSNGLPQELPLERAAIGYAIAQGAIVVACAGNEADDGMRYPAAYPEVISAGATAYLGQFPAADPSTYLWMLDDVAEGLPSEHPIAPFSSRALPGQELDLAAPGFPMPVAFTNNGQADYTFEGGTSFSSPTVAGVAALMLQKNPTLVQSQVEALLKASATPLGSGCATLTWPGLGPGNAPTWEDHDHVFFTQLTTCWGSNATGAGLLDADLALLLTPLP